MPARSAAVGRLRSMRSEHVGPAMSTTPSPNLVDHHDIRDKVESNTVGLWLPELTRGEYRSGVEQPNQIPREKGVKCVECVTWHWRPEPQVRVVFPLLAQVFCSGASTLDTSTENRGTDTGSLCLPFKLGNEDVALLRSDTVAMAKRLRCIVAVALLALCWAAGVVHGVFRVVAVLFR
eukprot:m.320308 g.320308  ORF g.320308 m.320308 type:complete len:178 (+) comp20317_c0_seq19:940-1473(+)